MATMTGLLAMTLLGAAPVADPCDEAISVQVRVLDMDGLGWRTGAYARLHPVATRGTATVWTADRNLVDDLVERAKDVSSIPRCDAVGEALISHKKMVQYVGNVDRKADGPVNGATKLAYLPQVQSLETGLEARICGRKIEQGMLAQVSLADLRVLAMHNVQVSEIVKPGTLVKPATCDAVAQANEVFRAGFELAFGAAPTPAPASEKTFGVSTTFKVPELARTEVEGEWLIPTDGILVVSLGIDTIADQAGRAIARERLAIVEILPDTPPTPIAVSQLNPAPRALGSIVGSYETQGYIDIATTVDESPIGVVQRRAGSLRLVPKTDDQVASTSFQSVPAVAALPMPTPPTRMMPLPVDANGNVVELPPLPIAISTLDDSVRPAANQPSPQSVHLSMVDPSLAQASFVAPAPGVTTTLAQPTGPSLNLGLQMKDAAGAPVQEAARDLTRALKTPGRTETIRFPLGGSLSLEIHATVVPTQGVAPAVAGRPEESLDRR